MATWTIVVVMETEKKRFTIPQDCTVSQLIKAVAVKANLRPETFGLAYTDQPELLTLEKDSIKTQKLSHFGIQDGSVLMLVLRMYGGMWVLQEICRRRRTLEDLPGFITVITDPNEPDMITFENDPQYRRAKMPCGHVIGPDTMTSYCKSLLSEGKFIFQCPSIDKQGRHCDTEWPFTLVRHVACLTPEELEEVEENIVQNVLVKAKGIKQCPGCQNWCFRGEPNNDSVACSVCTNKRGKVFQFCWQCMREWKGRQICGNEECLSSDKRIKILLTCTEIYIQKTSFCPSIRGCPKCGQLIEHIGHCKHITCKCGHAFCFYCLNPKRSQKGACAAYGTDCKLAARQIKLPNPKDAAFSVLYHPSQIRKAKLANVII